MLRSTSLSSFFGERNPNAQASVFEEMSTPEFSVPTHWAVHPTDHPFAWSQDCFSNDTRAFCFRDFQDGNGLSTLDIPGVHRPISSSSSPSEFHPPLGVSPASCQPVLSYDGVGCGSDDGDHGDGESSGGTRTVDSRRDRDRTLATERKRRGRMKEMLYELRALVPNITKMDKASIIADAVVYLKNMRQQVEQLEDELREMQAFSSPENQRRQPPTNRNMASLTVKGEIKDLTIVDLGKGRFYLRLECCCSAGQQELQPVAELYAAIESLDFLRLQNSDVYSVDEGFVLTSTVEVSENGDEVNSQAIRIWLISALVNECFEFKTM